MRSFRLQIAPLSVTVLLLMSMLLVGCVFYDTGSIPLMAPADVGSDGPQDMRDDVADAGDACGPQGCCLPETDSQICDRLVLNCGDVVALDNCDANRTVNCGFCSPPATCGGGGTPNVCACPQQSDQDFCALHAECGPVTATDACGQERTVDCGTCAAPETCGGAGASGICGCAVESDVVFCARQNGCGLLTSTDNCELPRSADCGTCADGTTCENNMCVCAPETDQAFCARLNGCEVLTAVDNCNVPRTADCGACGGGEACTNNQCACTPEDDATFCARLGSECGTRIGTDNCAAARTVISCGTCGATENCNAGTCDAAFPPSGVEIWLRSDKGVTFNAQDKVLSWADRLTGELWEPPAINSRPTLFSNGPGGFDLLRFYGGQRLSRSGPPLSSAQFTAFVVSSRAATSREGAILSVHGTSAAADHELAYGATDTTMRFTSSTGLSFSASVLPTSTTQVLTFRADGTAFEFYQSLAMTATTPHVPSSNFEFDAIGTFRFSDGLIGDVQEVIVWPRALSDAERAAVVGYLQSRYAL